MPNIFIMLIILHFVGDYYLQSKKLVNLREKNYWFVLIHSIIYSIPGFASLLVVDGSAYFCAVMILCGSHFVIDSIKFFIKPVHYSPKDQEEQKGNLHKANEQIPKKHLLKVDIRYFVDQFLHIAVIVLVSIFFLQKKPDIAMNQSVLTALNAKNDVLEILFKSVAAFVIILKPISLTFYKIFDIELLTDSRPKEKNENEDSEKISDIKGTGAIIGYMERMLMLCLLIMGEYTAIGFVIAGKSIIRLNGNIKQEFFIIGTFYGIITTLGTFIVFFML